MAKKKKEDKVGSYPLFIVLNSSDEYEGIFDTLAEAQEFLEYEENEGQIFEVWRRWQASYPPEPELEFHEVDL